MRSSGKLSTGLLIGALGVVFGDIGTSPLYVMKVVFGGGAHQLPVTDNAVLGLISLVIWTLTIVVSLKYISFIMRADNEGEGGIMALIARLKGSGLTRHTKSKLVFIGLIGVALFYGDSAITPAISVLSAVEGIQINHPDLAIYVVPLTVIILVWLFWIQKYGTALIGRLFGPVMLVWFATIAIGGIGQIAHYHAVSCIFVDGGSGTSGHGCGSSICRHGSFWPRADFAGVVYDRISGAYVVLYGSGGGAFEQSGCGN
jgi:KUP system potassium uptake protein